jgi:hypothetical protein
MTCKLPIKTESEQFRVNIYCKFCVTLKVNKFFSWAHLLSQKDGFFLQALVHNPLTVWFIAEIVAKKQNLNDFFNVFLCNHNMSVYWVTLNFMLILSYFMQKTYLTKDYSSNWASSYYRGQLELQNWLFQM